MEDESKKENSLVKLVGYDRKEWRSRDIYFNLQDESSFMDQVAIYIIIYGTI